MATHKETSTRLIQAPRYCAIQFIRAYQFIASPWVGQQCRFYPSCSHYALAVYRDQGFIKGTWLTLIRILKCNPWHQGGEDLPPVSASKMTTCNSCVSHSHTNGSN